MEHPISLLTIKSFSTAGLLKRQQSEEDELSLNNESFKLTEVNWLLGIPPGYAHDKKKFKILKVGDRSKNLSRALPSPPTGQLKNLGIGFFFYTRPFPSFNFDFVDLFYLKFLSIFSKRCNLEIHETNIKRTKRTSIKGKSFDVSPTLRILTFFFVMGISWGHPE